MKTFAFLALIALSALAAACSHSPTSPAPDRARWNAEADTTGSSTTQRDTTGSDSSVNIGGGHTVGSGG